MAKDHWKAGGGKATETKEQEMSRDGWRGIWFEVG